MFTRKYLLIGLLFAGVPGLTACRSGGERDRPANSAPKGVLELRILAEKADARPDEIDDFRAALGRGDLGPLGEKQGYRWFPIADAAEFFKAKDIGSEFPHLQKESLVVLERRGDAFFVLARVSPNYAMTHAPGAPEWSIQNAQVIRSTHGAAIIAVDLDERGAALLERLTQANLEKQLGIFLDGKAIMSATIKEVLKKSVTIHGSFSWTEAEDIAKLIRKATGLHPSR